MNNNFTQRENRNFVSKISDFFKILLALPADVTIVGIPAIVQNSNFPNQRKYSDSQIKGSHLNAIYNWGFAKPYYYGQHIFMNLKSK